jgi:hypothetical protein
MLGDHASDHQNAAQLQLAADRFLDRQRSTEFQLGHQPPRDQQLTDVRNGSD